MLADGNPASVGEQVITRTNNRTLRLTATDWVKNGDRWTVLQVSRSGDLTVRHSRNGRTVRLPAYVAESVELGYATTVHTAQGVTADTMHGLATGEESRQQLYDADPGPHRQPRLPAGHWGRRPAQPHPARDGSPASTATELLEQILARDAAARSASTLQRDQQDPAVRLGAPHGMSTPSMWPPKTWPDAKSSRRWR